MVSIIAIVTLLVHTFSYFVLPVATFPTCFQTCPTFSNFLEKVRERFSVHVFSDLFSYMFVPFHTRFINFPTFSYMFLPFPTCSYRFLLVLTSSNLFLTLPYCFLPVPTFHIFLFTFSYIVHYFNVVFVLFRLTFSYCSLRVLPVPIVSYLFILSLNFSVLLYSSTYSTFST